MLEYLSLSQDLMQIDRMDANLVSVLFHKLYDAVSMALIYSNFLTLAALLGW